MAIAARDRVNREAGTKRMFAHAIFTPGTAGLAGIAGARARGPARLHQGLHDRRQHQQGHQQVSLAPGRRAGHLQGLRAGREARHQEYLRAQGAVSRLDRAAVPASARLLRRARRRQGGQGLAAAQLRRLPLGATAMPAAATRPTAGGSSSRRAASPGSATSPISPRSSASPTSTATSASCSRRAWWRNPSSVRR